MTRKTTQMIKGVAILIMVMHHFCAKTLFPDLDGVLLNVGANCKICVAIYAVLSGYGYYFAKEKTVRYGLKKIWGLLQIYWISLFTLFIPAAIRVGWKLTTSTLFGQLFGLLPNINWFAWYVFFYVFCMMVMPFIYKVFKRKLIFNFGIAFFVPYLLEVIFHSVPNYENITIIHDLFTCFLYFPCFLVGYLMAQHRIMEEMDSFLPSNRKFRVFISVIGLVVVFMMRYMRAGVLGFLFDVFYAPLFVFFVAKLFEALQKRKICSIFSVLGKYSTGIWFFHAVFFSTYVSDLFRPILLLVKQPVFMYIWCVFLSLVGAFAFQKLLEGIKLLPKVIKGRT